MFGVEVKIKIMPDWLPRGNKSPKAVANPTIASLKRAGAYTRGIVQRMLPKGNANETSSPGKPPRVHTQERGLSLKEMVIFEVDPVAESLKIGYPETTRRIEGSNGSVADLATLHEFGGDGVSIVPRGSALFPRRAVVGRYYPYNNRRVQLTEGNLRQLQNYWFNRVVGKRQPYPARPFLAPSLEKAQPKFASFFKDTIKK